MPVRRDCEILDSMRSFPVIDKLPIKTPLAEVSSLLKAPSDERLPIRSPYTATYWLAEASQCLFEFTSLLRSALSHKFSREETSHKHSIDVHACLVNM